MSMGDPKQQITAIGIGGNLGNVPTSTTGITGQYPIGGGLQTRTYQTAMPEEVDTPFTRKALSQLVDISSKIEQDLEYEYSVSPCKPTLHHPSNIKFSVIISKESLVADYDTMDRFHWSISYSEDTGAYGASEKAEEGLKRSSLIRLTARMLHGVGVYIRSHPDRYDAPEKKESQQYKDFLFDWATKLVNGEDRPEELLVKMRLLNAD